MGAAQNLSNNLRSLRAAQGYSLIRYARMLNISKSTLQEIERGHSPHLDTVECIAESLHIPVCLLLSDSLPISMYSPSVPLAEKRSPSPLPENTDLNTAMALCRELLMLLSGFPSPSGPEDKDTSASQS